MTAPRRPLTVTERVRNAIGVANARSRLRTGRDLTSLERSQAARGALARITDRQKETAA